MYAVHYCLTVRAYSKTKCLNKIKKINIQPSFYTFFENLRTFDRELATLFDYKMKSIFLLTLFDKILNNDIVSEFHSLKQFSCTEMYCFLRLKFYNINLYEKFYRRQQLENIKFTKFNYDINFVIKVLNNIFH